MGNNLRKRSLSLALCLLLCLNLLPGAALAAKGGEAGLAATSPEPAVTVREVDGQAVDENDNPIPVKVKEYTYTFYTVPTRYEDIVQIELDSPYKTMALLFLALRTWTPTNPTDCIRMLDYLTNTGATRGDTGEVCPFSQYTPWVNFLQDRMTQNDKWKYIGNAYLNGATPENNYTPSENPITITVRQSPYDPYHKADADGPELKQVLVSIDGAQNDRYALFYQDGDDWKVWGDNWKGLLADIQPAEEEKILPPAYERPATLDQKEPDLKIEDIPAKAAGVDESGNPIVIDTTVQQYTYTFSKVPENYEDIVQYQLDSPYKTLALFFLALRTWDPNAPQICWQMLDYLTNPAVDSEKTDDQGRKLSKSFSEYTQWTQFLDRQMKQNNKYRFIGNAYLGGATPENDYTPDTPVTITVRQSTYDPYKAAYQGINGPVPELKQVLIDLEGADNPRYSLLYQDARGDWRIFGDNWKGLLADVQTPYCDILWPPEYTRPTNPAHRQKEPTEKIMEIPAKAPGVDDDGNPIVIDTTVKQHVFTFSTIPTCYEDIVQYKLDSPYKTMALMIMAFRTWTRENRTDCLQMMNYLTNTNVDSYKTDAAGHKLSKNFSDHQSWYDFMWDRMTQPTTGPKYRYIGNAYLGGAMPANDYTPSEPYTVTVKESVYNPYKGASSTQIKDADPPIYQVLITLPGADNDRYSLFYQDQRGDWRVFGDNWKGLLTDVKTPDGDYPWPAEVASCAPKTPQQEPQVETRDIPAKAAGVDEHGDPIVINTKVKEYTYTFNTVPTCYEDLVQYELDSPYKTMALLFLSFRTWDPDNPEICAKMLEYLTNTAVEKPKATDAQGHKLAYGFSEYLPWIQALRDRMIQNGKYEYIGNAYLNGATPGNHYTPSSPVKITVRQSTYDPYKDGTETTPELMQVLIKIPGADNDRYSLFYQDQRGAWRVFGDNWQGLLADVRSPGAPTSPVSIGNAIRAGDTVAFTVEQDDSRSAPLVASYDEDGRMIAVERAESAGKEGDLETFEAGVSEEGSAFRILLPGSNDFHPLCGAWELK